MGWTGNDGDRARGGRRLMTCIFGVAALVAAPGCGLTRTVTIDSTPSGGTLRIDGTDYRETPHTATLTWTKDPRSEDHTHLIEVTREDYGISQVVLGYDEARTHGADEPWTLNVPLAQVRREVPVDIVANVRDAIISVNDQQVAKTDGRYTFFFTRDDPGSPWSTFLVVVEKDGYRYRAAGSRPQPGEAPPFSTTLSIDHPAVVSGKLEVELEPVRFVRTKLRRWVPTGEGIQLEEEVTLAEIETEPAVHSVTKITDAKHDEDFMETRVSVVPNSRNILYSFPHRLSQDKSLCANLWVQQGAAKRRLTDGPTLDLEATVSADGKWVYFSSDRLGQNRFNIWRISADRQGGLTKITDSPSSSIDTEPAISPEGTRMAYTSYQRGSSQPQVWVANTDGTLPTQIRTGRSPAWSPDGRLLAFSARDNNGYDQIWVMESHGGPPTQVTTGNHRHRHPCFTPGGDRLVYASDQALNEEGQPNFDIWVMNEDGTGKTQLTVNGSYDSRPIISDDGRYVYFVSNRGAVNEFDEALQIWRLQLEP